jgi:hypothetical protein
MTNGQIQDDTNNPDSNNPAGSGQGVDPNVYQNLAQPYPYNPQQVPVQPGQQAGVQQLVPQQQIPQQEIQPQSISPSPEVPARVETSESMIMPEIAPEQVQSTEQEKQDKRVEEQDKTTEKAPDVAPDKTRFESPFKVYGYRISQKIANLGKKLKNSKTKRDTSSSKTWLIVLLGRLLRMYKGEGLKKAE